jgi:hypothetical protein
MPLKNNFPCRARAKMGYLGVRTMDFELEHVLTQNLARRPRGPKGKTGGGVQHEDFPAGHPS